MASPRREVKKDGTVVYKIEPSYKGKRLKAGRFPTRNEALQYQEDCITEAKQGVQQGYKLLHAFEKFELDLINGKRDVKGKRWELVRLKKLARDPLADEFLQDLNDEHIDDWIDRCRGEGLGNSSILREIALLQAVLKRCRKWRWMKQNPFELVVDRPKAGKHRERRPEQWETDAILQSLKLNPAELHVRLKKHEVGVLWLLAMETAMRLSEMTTLGWDQVGEYGVQLDDSKNGDGRQVPFTSRAFELLDCLPSKGQRDNCFFVDAGPASSAFYKARKDAGVDGLTFHDSRHEGATRLAKLYKHDFAAFVKIGGWRNPKQALVYFNPTMEELAEGLR